MKKRNGTDWRKKLFEALSNDGELRRIRNLKKRVLAEPLLGLRQWQKEYADELRAILAREGVALLQLPTGAGKTAIALAALAGMRPVPRVTIAMPRRPGRAGGASYLDTPWVRDLWRFDYSSSWQEERCLSMAQNRTEMGWPAFDLISHRDLIRRRSRKLIPYRRRGFNPRYLGNSILIIDEAHRARGLLDAIRALKRMGPRGKLRVLLLSATPVNPVWLSEEHVSGLSSHDRDEAEDKSIEAGYERIYRAMISLSRTRKWPEENGESLRDVIESVRELQGAFCVPKAEDLIRRHRARGRLEDPPDEVLGDESLTRDAIDKLVTYMSKGEALRWRGGFATAERFALAGCLKTAFLPKSALIPPPGSRRRQAIHKAFSGEYDSADAIFRNREVRRAAREMEHKLKALERFLKHHFSRGDEAGRVLVFCRFRRTVWWVSAWLESRWAVWGKPGGLGEGGAGKGFEKLYGPHGARRLVWDSQTYADSQTSSGKRRAGSSRGDTVLRKAFDSKHPLGAEGYGCVLVTSDRLSESIDLQQGCDTIVHFDMDWSPLRMLQRVGRIWRHSSFAEAKRKGRGGRVQIRPAFPQVFHLRYPCSVDDEIYDRLRRRWEYLV